MAISWQINDGMIYLSGNPIEVKLNTTSIFGAGYKLCIELSCPALMGSPFVEEIAPDAAGNATFEISGFADQPMDHEFQFPAIGVSVAHSALIFDVGIRVGCVYKDGNGNRVVSWNSADPVVTLRILKGKLRQQELNVLNEMDSNFQDEYISMGKFMTHLPNNQKVKPGQIQKLWFLAPGTESIESHWHCLVKFYHCEIDHYQIDGDVTLYGIQKTDLSTTGLCEFNVEPAFMGIPEAITYEAITEFTFWLTDDLDADISERRRWIVDNDYHEESLEFLYLNSLSGIDPLWLTGSRVEGLKTESEAIYKPVPVGSGMKASSLKTVSSLGQRSWDMNTGHKTRQQMLALRDFLESRECWLIDPDDSTRLIPVNVVAGDFNLYDSMEDLHSLQIKIVEAHK